MAKQRFDESKVTRGPDGRFIAQGGAVELRMVYPDPGFSTLPAQRQTGGNLQYGNYKSSHPGQERLLKINQHGLDMLHQLGQPGAERLYRGGTSAKSSRRRGSVA